MKKATGEDKVQSAVFAPSISETYTRCASKGEPQSELQLAHCAGRCDLPEGRRANRGTVSYRRIEAYDVENIVGVRPKLQAHAFPKARHAKVAGDRQIHILTSRTTHHVPTRVSVPGTSFHHPDRILFHRIRMTPL